MDRRVADIGQKCVNPGKLQAGGCDVLLRSGQIGGAVRTIQHDQLIAGFDLLSIMHIDFAHHANFKWLDNLDLAGRDQCALCRADDRDFGHPGPKTRHQKQHHQNNRQYPCDRIWGTFGDLQNAGHKGAMILFDHSAASRDFVGVF